MRSGLYALGLAIILAACSDQGAPTPSSGALASIAPSSTQSATASDGVGSSTSSPVPGDPTAEPSSSAAVAMLGVGSIAEVTVDGLRVRTGPGVDAGEAAPGPTGTLDAGNRVYVAAGPVSASGYEWYFVSEDPPVFWQPLGCPTPPGDCGFPALGWVAAGSTDTPWLRVVDPGCPQPPYDFFEIHQLGPLHRLSCLTGETITITGQIALGERGWEMPILEAEPSWLGGLVSPILLSGGSGAQAVLPVRYAPEFGACLPDTGDRICELTPFDDQLVKVDLVVDHPASPSCRPATSNTPAEVAVLRCRAQLVVTSVRASGAP